MRKENEEFIALFEASGWNQSQAGRRLHKDRASVSRYISGKIPPEKSVLELFKLILGSEKPEALTALTVSHPGMDHLRENDTPFKLSGDGVHEKLSALKREDPAAYDVVKIAIEFLHDRANPRTPRPEGSVNYRKSKRPTTNSKLLSEAQSVLKKASVSSKSDPAT